MVDHSILILPRIQQLLDTRRMAEQAHLFCVFF